MTTYALVGCGADKADKPMPARDLYTSSYFEKKRRIAEILTEESGGKWWVLSAKHHVVQPDEVIEPYERPMSELTEDQTAAWAAEVKVQLSMAPWLDDEESTLLVLAGQDYLNPIREWLESHGCELDLPFEDTSGQGEQNRLLKRWVRRLENRSLAEY